MISLVLGLMAAAGVIGLREVLDDTFKAVAEVEEALNLAREAAAAVPRRAGLQRLPRADRQGIRQGRCRGGEHGRPPPCARLDPRGPQGDARLL
jgi:hypothetical protein